MSFKFKMTIPKPNLKWYNTSKKELLKAVEEYNKENWAAETDPATGKNGNLGNNQRVVGLS